MNTPNHSVAPEDVMALLDGELPGPWDNFVQGHVAECDDCGATSAKLREVSRELQTWRVEALPSRVEERVLAVASAYPGNYVPRKIAWRAWRFPLWARWAVAGGLTAVAALLLYQQVVFKRMAMVDRALVARSSGPTTPNGVGNEQESVEADEVQSSVLGKLPAAEASYSEAENEITPPGTPTSEDAVRGPMIARTVALTIVVKDFSTARGTLDAILARHHGYAAELNVNTAEGVARTLQVTLRVPDTELSSTLSELKSLGRVENETQSGEEVTQQHADLAARLKNSRETEQQLQAILRQRTGKIGDVLRVEQEIARVRGEIEQMEAQQEGLEHRVSFATVNLNLADVYQAQLKVPSPSIGTRLRNAFVAGLHNASETVLGLALFFIEYGPALLVWLTLLGLPVFVFLRRYRRSLAAV